MRFRAVSLSASVGAALLISGCGSSTTEDANAPSTMAADDMAAATASMAPMDAASGAAGTMLPLTGQAFVDTVSASDHFEMESARIVQSAGVTGPTRDFAQMMMKDHEASSRELGLAVGAAGNVRVESQPSLTAEQQGQLEELRGAGKDAVASIYARQQVAAHEKALAVLQTYAQSGDAQPLMDFAGKTAGVVSKHLEQARRLP